MRNLNGIITEPLISGVNIKERKALEIIRALADGIDTYTGEVLLRGCFL